MADTQLFEAAGHNDTTALRVQEFARLAGVTVRALHLYDEAGLLSPSTRTKSGHRRYRRQDLLRLQQIMTLKYLGFSLEEIRALVSAPAFDLPTALQMQQAAIEERILKLQGVVMALARTRETIEANQEVSWPQVIAVIRGLREAGTADWIQRYFPSERWEWLQRRAAAMPQALIERSAAAWRELYDGFRRLLGQPVESADVQRLAAQMEQLISLFTEGNPEIEQGLAALYQDPQINPTTFWPDYDPALQDFMSKAHAYYRQRRQYELPDR